jgi:hypothetical protein
MLDDELREQLAAWVRPVTTLPVPDIRVLRRRARRRGVRRAAAAAVVTAVAAAAAVGVVASLPGAGGLVSRGSSSPVRGSPPGWSPAPGTWIHGAWQPSGPPLAADASPADAPYIVIPGWGRDGGLQVRDVFTGAHLAIVPPLSGQYLFQAAGAGDDRTFVVAAETGGRTQSVGGPPIDSTAVAFDELRLRPDGQPESLRLLFSVPMTGSLFFAISQDASMLAYTTGSNVGFETVSLAAGTGRFWPAVDSEDVAPGSLSWAGDRTMALEWTAAVNPHPTGLGIRILDVTAPGTVLQASRLIVPYRRYCAANAGGGWGCDGDPVITPDGSKVMVTKGVREGVAYTDSVVEYSTRTGQALAYVAPPVSSAFPGTLCVPVWTNPSGEQVITLCGHPEKYDQGRVTSITVHPPMYGTDIMPFGWQPGSPGT